MLQVDTNKGRWVGCILSDVRGYPHQGHLTSELSCLKEAEEVRQVGRLKQALVVGDGWVAPFTVQQVREPVVIGWLGRAAKTLEQWARRWGEGKRIWQGQGKWRRSANGKCVAHPNETGGPQTGRGHSPQWAEVSAQQFNRTFLSYIILLYDSNTDNHNY